MSKLELNLVLVMIMMLIASMDIHGSMADEHTVGGSFSWRVPEYARHYADWSSHNQFKVKDVLLFNFTTGYHDVAEVTKDAYDQCDCSYPISLYKEGPIRLTLETAEDHYYICTIVEHCNLSQKLAVRVDLN
ncbi:umecyanin-like [Rutidosis leptorrhynchoides]|uniref:umecyanin-like n=1 Tax=Rutidosis leptorrhynchoides TaxID=125765 RepID=UPI003A99A042